MDVEDARARRWRYDRGTIKTFPRAAKWIDDVGFALLWEGKGLALPALWTVATDHDGWGPDAERVWGWKDELPKRGKAWYGHFIRGRKSFLAPALLRDLYPRAGHETDFHDADLGADAARIAEVVLVNGPTSLAVLREAVNLEGKAFSARFTKAVKELGRALVVTHHGVSDDSPGWPSAVLELTARAFEVSSPDPVEVRRRRAAHAFLDTVLEASPSELARAFGWSAADAREALDRMVASGDVVRAGSSLRLA